MSKVCLFLLAVVILAACGSKDSSKSTPKSDARFTAEQQLKLTAEVLAPQQVTDSAALEADFNEVQKKYPRLRDYLSRQETVGFLAAVAATKSCNTSRDRFLLTTAAQVYRRSLCPDHVLTPVEGLVVFPTCTERCLRIVIQCLHYPFGSEQEQSCMRQANACRTACENSP
jgi:hypothetical protein